MAGYLKRYWFQTTLVVLLFAIVGAIVYQSTAHQADKKTFKVFKKAPGFTLDTVDGRKMSLSDTDGKVRLIYFFYTNCPDVCSPTSFKLGQVQDLLKEKKTFGKDTEILSVTLDPKRDTPEVIKQFAAQFHADSAGWTYFRGSEEDTKKLAEQYEIADIQNPQDSTITHSNVIFLVDRKGNIRYYYNGSDPELTAASIANDMAILSKEK